MWHFNMDQALAESTICDFLSRRPGAPRRLIQSFLVFSSGFHPVTVTKALSALVEARTLNLSFFPNPYGPQNCHLFSLAEPDLDYVFHITAAYRDLRDAIPNRLFKRAGEEYVRALLSHCGRFRDITQRHRLGRVNEGRGLTLDLAAADVLSGQHFGISVKNQNGFLRQDAPAISDCFTRAREHRVRPWLFVPFATPEAIRRCTRDGIQLTVLGRQMLPTETDDGQLLRFIVGSFRQDIFGDQAFDFVYKRFTKTRTRSMLVERDLTLLAVDSIDLAA
jgi:hypothetical protein